MMWGQRPHVDFYSPLGVGAYFPTAAGLMLSGTVNAFGIGQALAAMVLAVWAVLLGYRRLSIGPLFLFCLLIVLTAAGVSDMGFPTLSFTPAMTYNRHCYALVMLILLESLVPPANSATSSWLGGVSTGLALTLALFTKISFFLGAAVLVILLLPCLRQSKPRLLGVLTAFLISAAAISAYFHFDLRPMFGDIGIAAKAKHIRLRFYLLDNLMQNAAITLLFGTGAWVVFKDKGMAIAGAAIAVVGVAFVLTCYEPAGFPLLALFGVIVLNKVGRAWRTPTAFLAVCAGFLLTVDIGSYSVGLVAASVRTVNEDTGCHALEQKKMTGFAVCRPDWGYVDFVKDGVQLIESHRSADDTVCSLDFSNPFPFAMGIRPMQGGTTNQQFQTTFSQRAFPSAERIFGNASLVMLPKTFSDESLYFRVEEIYGPFLHAHFSPIGESKFWTLYRRT